MQALWMVLAAFWFALMAVGIKYASVSFGTFELVFYRGIVSVVFMTIVVRIKGTPLRTPVPLMHVWRSVIGVVSLSSWFYAIAHLPLATAMTLNYMSGVWVAAFVVGGALLYGKQQPQGALIATVLLGFVGVVMTLRPTMDQNQLFAGVVGLLSGMGSAMAYLQVTALGRAGEPEERTVFYFSFGSVAVGLLGVCFTTLTPWSAVRWQDAAWLVPIGIFASLGQWCMTRAYSKGATLVVASMQYFGIVFSVVFGLLLFGNDIEPLGWCGIALIIFSGVLATILRTRALPHTPAEEH
jgi:S-adenosylmethionine uptake transporter